MSGLRVSLASSPFVIVIFKSLCKERRSCALSSWTLMVRQPTCDSTICQQERHAQNRGSGHGSSCSPRTATKLIWRSASTSLLYTCDWPGRKSVARFKCEASWLAGPWVGILTQGRVLNISCTCRNLKQPYMACTAQLLYYCFKLLKGLFYLLSFLFNTIHTLEFSQNSWNNQLWWVCCTCPPSQKQIDRRSMSMSNRPGIGLILVSKPTNTVLTIDVD